MKLQRFFVPLYLLTLLCTGLGYLAILPAFEGFDETAHYSSIRQIADTATIPIYGKSFIDREVADYRGPLPYTSLAPPYDDGLTYAKFFADPPLTADYLTHYRQSTLQPPYSASDQQNWQAQHPPLYYILLAPIEKAASQLPLVTRIFILRLVSFLMALTGVAFGLLASRNPQLPLKSDPAVIGFLFYPLILPMFFPEFTRIGNDSLCLLLVGITAFLLSKYLKDESDRKLPVALGVTLGLGLLTKAFFLPITAALAIFLSVRIACKSGTRSGRWKNLLLILLPALIIGGGWYIYKFMAFGTVIGSNDAINLANQGGLISNLKQNFSLYGIVRGLTVTFVSYSWAGTWSLTRLPIFLHLPVLGLAAWGFGSYLFQIKRRPLTDPAWLPALLFGIFGIGFLYHVIISVAINGNGNTPGWYLHILMPWVAPALGAGFYALFQNPRTKFFLIILLLYAFAFQTIAIWAQFTLFTGCATKSNEKYYAFSGHTLCLDQIPLLFDRLSFLGLPSLAIAGFSGGIICALLLLALWKKPHLVNKLG